MNRPDKRKRIWAVGLFVLAMGLTCGFLSANKTNRASATLAGWNASNIITDYVMTDYGSMNESQIQSFLKSKVNCNNTELWRRQSTKVTWNIKDGHFVCMADDRFNGETAAHIIWQAAQDYRINPKVLIVTLQKESSLITDSMPHSGQYRTAMGFGCPDTAACDAKYFGLKNQIRNAARFFRAYQDNASGWYKPYWTGSYKVHWHPDLNRCGGTVLNIQNRATASLYSYTPYQPNQAALNAGWGTGDTCSAYGNRNFYNYFTSWFGDTRKNIAIVKTTLPDNYYRLILNNDYNQSLQLATANTTGGTNIIVGSRKNNNIDNFYLKVNPDGSYSMANTYSKMNVDIPNINAENGQEIKQWAQNTSDAQKFLLYDNEDGTYSIASQKNPYLVLTKSLSGKIILDIYSRSIDQKFRLINVNAPIAEGVYNLTSAVDYNNRALDIYGGHIKQGDNISLWSKNQSKAQAWKLSYDSNTGYYKLNTVINNQSLDINGASKVNGANAQLWVSNNSCAQKWQIIKSGEGFKLLNACSGKALDVNKASSTLKTNVQLWSRNSSKAQDWKFTEFQQIVPDGEYQLLSAIDPRFALEVDSNNTLRGTNVLLKNSSDGPSQRLKIQYDRTTGYYNITHISSGNNIDVTGNNSKIGANVATWTQNNSNAQKWQFWRNSDGSYRIISACGDLSLDINGAKIQNDTNIQLWSENVSSAQKWLLK